ncbi:MAG: hypothetical protein IH840_10225, partial [Candidatus Heimdallarchaeota archaeon]|nr:hypothetical protein [Candidatus Heimdallarchaeota archaeon]
THIESIASEFLHIVHTIDTYVGPNIDAGLRGLGAFSNANKDFSIYDKMWFNAAGDFTARGQSLGGNFVPIMDDDTARILIKVRDQLVKGGLSLDSTWDDFLGWWFKYIGT